MNRQFGAIWVLGVFFIFANEGLAQAVFSSSYGVGYNNISWVRGVANPNGGFCVSARPTGGDIEEYVGAILRTDSAGESVNTTRYVHSGTDMITAMFWSAGHIYTASLGGMLLGEDDALIRKIDQDGDVVWAVAFDREEASHTNLYDMTTISSGDLVGIGESNDGDSSNGPLLVRFTEGGELVWAKDLVFGGPGVQLSSICASPSGGVFVSGRWFGPDSLMKMLLVHIGSDGTPIWARTYASSDFAEANQVVVDAWTGPILLGRHIVDGSSNGVVMRLNMEGEPLEAFQWARDVRQGHLFADGSLMLMSELSDQSTFARIGTDMDVQWSTTLDGTPWGQLIPFDESTRFAYVSSMLFSDVTIHTFTDECQACDPVGSGFSTTEPVLLEAGACAVTATSVGIVNLPVPMTPTDFVTTRSAICDGATSTDFIATIAAPRIKCKVDPTDHSLWVEGLQDQAAEVAVVGMRGDQVALSSTMNSAQGSAQARFRLPEELSGGVYMAIDPRSGSACRFVALPR